MVLRVMGRYCPSMMLQLVLKPIIRSCIQVNTEESPLI